MTIRKMGDMRKFLFEAMEKVSSGKLGAQEAQAIASLAKQVNTSIIAEVTAREHMVMKEGFSDLPMIDALPMNGKSNGMKYD